MSELTSTPILIDGATGYVGSHLAWHLIETGYRARCLVRPGANAKDLEFLRASGAEVVTGDLMDGSAALALKGCDVAVHLIGSIAPRKGETLAQLHTAQTEALVKHCREAAVQKIVMVTALGTAPDAESAYHLTKWHAEEIVRDSGLKYVILRPSLIVGRLVGRRDSKLVHRYFELILRRPRVPLIGGGTNKVQPLFIGDLVGALLINVLSDEYLGQTLELGGPEQMTMREFVRRFMQVLQVDKPLLDLPYALAGMLAGLCETFQDRPLLSKDQVLLSRRDNICLHNSLPDILGGLPASCEEALASYLKVLDALEGKSDKTPCSSNACGHTHPAGRQQ